MNNARNVLCYVRPWNNEQMVALATEAFPGSGIDTCSEHVGIDSTNLGKVYRTELKKKKQLEMKALPPAITEDMIRRCRLLRALPYKEARRHLLAMATAVESLFRARTYDAVISLTVDSFIIDLVQHFAKINSVPFLGLVPSFVNGYFRITARGESALNDSPPLRAELEIREKLLRDDYKPDFVSQSITNPSWGIRKRWLKNVGRVPYFYLKRFFSGDLYNYHYWASQIVCRDFASFLPAREPGRSDWFEIISTESRPIIYLPLQMFPECTVDYWCIDPSVTEYYSQFESLIDRFHNKFLFVIKEHPAIMGQRPRGWYERLSQDSRVLVIPTYTPSNEVLKKAAGVLVWTGTVGYEAALRGKAVFELGQPFYAAGPRFLHIDSQTTPTMLLEHIKWCENTPCSGDEQKELIRFLVGQLHEGTFRNDGKWSRKNASDISNLKIVATSLRSYYDSIN